MIKTKSNSFLKFSFIFIISSLTLFVLGSIISNVSGTPIKDVMFIEGIVVLMLSVFSLIEGNTTLPSMQEFGRINPQYLVNMILESNENARKKINRNSTLNIQLDISSLGVIVAAFISVIFSFTI
ncbi:MAG: hypothetical protein KIC47_00145 [Clostridium sp.]|nr:hypothetical protein [Clostridium sp.]MBS5948718.1 hypothetical protein [Clostridium sp.]